MNKIFKIVFNAARGKMMVVNEATSSVQTGKKAAVTVAVVAALAAGSAMADTITTGPSSPVTLTEATTISGNTYQGIEITKGGSGTDGAALSFNGNKQSLTITDSYFIDNKVTDTSVANGAYGGAVGVGGSANVTLNNVTFKGNLADTSPVDAVTSGNSQGAGLYQSGGQLNATNVVFEENKATGTASSLGTGMSLYEVNGTIDGALFKNNSSDALATGNYENEGGALYLRPTADGEFTVKNSVFEGNSITSKWGIGGAVSLRRKTTFDNVDFINNVVNCTESAQGGAMLVYSATATVKNSTFNGNQSSGEGGAIYIYGGSTLTSENNTFTSNTAGTTGGAIHNAGELTLTGTNTFTGNTAAGKANDIYNVGTINLAEGSVLSLAGGLNGEGTVEGTGSIVITDAAATITGQTVADTITASATGEVNDALGGDITKLESNLGGVTVTGMEEGAVMGAVGPDGEMQVNAKTEALADKVSLAPAMITRIMMNDVRKRMGDLRAAEGTHGVWARYNGGQMSATGVDADFSMVQVGIDTVPVVDAPRFGVAFSYAETEAKDNLGTTDMDSFSLAFYGTKMYDNGMFVDVIGRMATMDSDIDNAGYTGKMDNVALSLSGELGWRFDVTDRFFFEPSVEATYTYTNADTFTMSNGGTYELEATDSLVGRAGFAAGFKCPANKGDVYVRAAVVHEFMGDMTVNSSINGVAAASLEADGKDTWFEYAIGAQFNVNKNTYVYADIERTEGAAMDEDWRANVGVRFAF